MANTDPTANSQLTMIALIMTRNKPRWTSTQKQHAKHLRIAADPNITTDHSLQQPLQPNDFPTAPSSALRFTWHAATTISNLDEAAGIARVRTETKAAFDALKAQGLSSTKIMSELLRGKRGSEFHATKMVVQAEKCKERAKEFRLLFPEIRGVPESISQADWNRLLRAQGYGNKAALKAEVKMRREAKGVCAVDEGLFDDEFENKAALNSRKRERVGDAWDGEPLGMLEM